MGFEHPVPEGELPAWVPLGHPNENWGAVAVKPVTTLDQPVEVTVETLGREEVIDQHSED
jgi:hypothetical protein